MLLTFVASAIFAQQKPVQIEWTTFEPKGINLSVEFPGRLPDLDPKRPNRIVGGTLRGTLLINEDAAYVLAYCDLPEGTNSEDFLPKAWEDHVAKITSVQVTQKSIDAWQGKPCFEGTYSIAKQFKARIRLVVSDNRLIQQLATWTEATYDKVSVERFFASLKFTSSSIPTARTETYHPAPDH